MAGRSRVGFWIVLALAGVVFFVSAWWAGSAGRAVAAGPRAAVSGSARLSLRFGAARGLVLTRATARSRRRVDAVVTVSGLVLPRLGGSKTGRLEFLVAGLCGGAMGPAVSFSSRALTVPSAKQTLPQRHLRLRLPAECSGKAPLGAFVRVLVVAVSPRVVYRTVSGSVSGLSSREVGHAS